MMVILSIIGILAAITSLAAFMGRRRLERENARLKAIAHYTAFGGEA